MSISTNKLSACSICYGDGVTLLGQACLCTMNWNNPPIAATKLETPSSIKGWECPKCGHCYAPTTPACTNCNRIIK